VRASKGSCWLTALMRPVSCSATGFASAAITFAVTMTGTTKDVYAFPVCPSAEFCHVPPSAPRHSIHAVNCNGLLQPSPRATRPPRRCTSDGGAAHRRTRSALRGTCSARRCTRPTFRRTRPAFRSTAYGSACAAFRCARTAYGSKAAFCGARSDLRRACRAAYSRAAYSCATYGRAAWPAACELRPHRARTWRTAPGTICFGPVAAQRRDACCARDGTTCAASIEGKLNAGAGELKTFRATWGTTWANRKQDRASGNRHGRPDRRIDRA